MLLPNILDCVEIGAEELVPKMEGFVLNVPKLDAWVDITLSKAAGVLELTLPKVDVAVVLANIDGAEFPNTVELVELANEEGSVVTFPKIEDFVVAILPKTDELVVETDPKNGAAETVEEVNKGLEAVVVLKRDPVELPKSFDVGDGCTTPELVSADGVLNIEVAKLVTDKLKDELFTSVVVDAREVCSTGVVETTIATAGVKVLDIDVAAGLNPLVIGVTLMVDCSGVVVAEGFVGVFVEILKVLVATGVVAPTDISLTFNGDFVIVIEFPPVKLLVAISVEFIGDLNEDCVAPTAVDAKFITLGAAGVVVAEAILNSGTEDELNS